MWGTSVWIELTNKAVLLRVCMEAEILKAGVASDDPNRKPGICGYSMYARVR
jgi:hypothetical protein